MMGLCALAALAVVSCKKNEEKAAMTSFVASLTQPTSDAKTHIGDGNWLMWDNGDAIKVFDANGNASTFTTTDNNTKVANFEGEIEASYRYCAFYPAAKASDLTGGKVVLTLSGEQDYAEGGFANGTYPMAAVNEGTSFEFHSPCGLLAIPMQGMGTIGSVELTGKLNEPLAGQLLVAPVGFDPSNPTYTLGETQATVTLGCGSGLALDTDNAKTLFFVLPKNVFTQGFTAKVKGTNGNEIYRLETTNNNVIVAESIRLMPVVNVASLGVTTLAANAGNTGATLNGSYAAPAGMTVTEVGFYWGSDAAAMTNRVTATVGTDFSYVLDGLAEGTEYAYQAFAKNGETEYTGGVVTFTTGVSVVLPTVTTGQVTNVAVTTATASGTVASTGNGNITAYGIAYSTTDGFEGNDGTQVPGSNLNEGAFTVSLTGLTGTTTYYVRAYATNEAGTAYGEQVSFTTETPFEAPTVTTGAAEATSASTATGHVTLTAAGTGPVTEIGLCWGLAENPTISPTAVNFAAASGQEVGVEYTVDIEGLGAETTYYVRGYAKVGDDYYYATTNASFTTPAAIIIPEGAINGQFTIDSYGHKVYFSQGNLQYTKSTETWSFMEHQYDMVETNNQNVGSNYAAQDVVSLFGWATSGWQCDNRPAYLPYETNSEPSYYGPSGSSDLVGEYAHSDWGIHNAISNGGDVAGQWHTLDIGAWYYLFNERSASTVNGTEDARYAKATVNNVAGVILFPDSYVHPDGVMQPECINTANAVFTVNSYTDEEWTTMENAGCVFLPTAGKRSTVYGGSPFWYTGGVNNVGIVGQYWTITTGSNSYVAHALILNANNVIASGNNAASNKNVGCSVRLVCDVE